MESIHYYLSAYCDDITFSIWLDASYLQQTLSKVVCKKLNDREGLFELYNECLFMYFLLYIQTRNCFKNDKKGGNILLLIYFDPIQSNPIKPIKTIAHKDLLCNVLCQMLGLQRCIQGTLPSVSAQSTRSQNIYRESHHQEKKIYLTLCSPPDIFP